MDRLHELRDMFGAGQLVTSLVGDLFAFLGEVLPLMEEIDASLRESTGHMPQATLQLQNVTEANEVATTEILDLVDAILARLSSVATHLTTAVRPDDAEPEETPAGRLRALLRERLADSDPALLAEAECLLDADAARGAARAEAAAAGEAELQEARDSMNRILVSLQVQDITAQQLASVNHLIESIRAQLSKLLCRLAAEEEPDEPRVSIDPDTFNAGARYDRSGAQQAVADQVTSSQDDIDALFGG